LKAWNRFLVVTALLVAALFVAWKSLAAFRPPPEVDVVELTREPIERTLVATGRVRPDLVIELGPLVAGQLVGDLPPEGSRLEAGAVAFRVDDRAARQALAAARAAVIGIREEAAQAGRELLRLRALAADGLVSSAALEDAEVTAARAAAQQIERERRFDELQVDLATYEAKVPFAAVVLRRLVDAGTNVDPSSKVLRLASTDSATIEVEVDELFYDSLRLGAAARLAPLGGGSVVAGRVIHIGDAVDRTSGAALVRVAPKSRPAGWITGRSIDVTIVVDQRDAALAVPREAVLDLDTAARVLVVDANGVVGSQSIVVLDWPAPTVILESGLEPGALVVREPRSTEVGAIVRPRRVSP
jgi:RND family efflux transporter MFP subunit